MEERLWAHLTHRIFAEYMAVRWPPKDANIVHRRYLFEGNSFAALSRNGISRLWWAGYLTRDEGRSDPYELTKVLFLRQDIQVSVLERAMGKCRSARVALLEFIRDNQAQLSEERFGRRVQILVRELNLLGGVAVLDAIPAAELSAYLKKVAGSFVRSPGPSAATVTAGT
jgi:hypothetical protein